MPEVSGPSVVAVVPVRVGAGAGVVRLWLGYDRCMVGARSYVDLRQFIKAKPGTIMRR